MFYVRALSALDVEVDIYLGSEEKCHLRVFTYYHLPLFSGCATILTLLAVCHNLYIVSGQLASNQKNGECICVFVYIRNGG